MKKSPFCITMAVLFSLLLSVISLLLSIIIPSTIKKHKETTRERLVTTHQEKTPVSTSTTSSVEIFTCYQGNTLVPYKSHRDCVVHFDDDYTCKKTAKPSNILIVKGTIYAIDSESGQLLYRDQKCQAWYATSSVPTVI